MRIGKTIVMIMIMIIKREVEVDKEIIATKET